MPFFLELSGGSLHVVTIRGGDDRSPSSSFILCTTGKLSEPVPVLWGF